MTDARRDPREEAERLVAAALAAMSMAANSTTGFATGSAECCVCPLCKAIAAARDPDPEFAERLATGAGDLAAGVASFLRNFGERPAPGRRPGAERPSAEPGAERPAGAPGPAAAEPGEPRTEPNLGDLVAGAASVLRGFGERLMPPPPPEPPKAPRESAGAEDDGDPWQAATRKSPPGEHKNPADGDKAAAPDSNVAED
ncbi:hypothetical protein [Dactylosporangium matsuzakiense]|uniref:Uncharacterized protein n=1 Tax=Dactylosporangium matsuzakiense TaxID=53360 RepID=A0A9W6NR54_9ACTN|nr:hypothetical protein [Dactylosporangium matsuzakiense]GLL05847.1 hypothetical protein GCM10017581_075950 [Dactylosporangium matsuzakiense]